MSTKIKRDDYIVNPIELPQYTQIPNVIFDEWMQHLSAAELQIIMIVCRKTFGWHKDQDAISYSQFAEILNVDKAHVIRVIKRLVDKGFLVKKVRVAPDGNAQANVYGLPLAEKGNPGTPPKASHRYNKFESNRPVGARKVVKKVASLERRVVTDKHQGVVINRHQGSAPPAPTKDSLTKKNGERNGLNLDRLKEGSGSAAVVRSSSFDTPPEPGQTGVKEAKKTPPSAAWAEGLELSKQDVATLQSSWTVEQLEQARRCLDASREPVQRVYPWLVKALEGGWSPPASVEGDAQRNRRQTHEQLGAFDGKQIGRMRFDILPGGVQFSGGNSTPIFLDFKLKDFHERVQETYRECTK